VVHLNCGLHDVKRAPDTNALLVPLEEYRATVQQILEQAQQGTHAAVIWATTTPVNEAHHQAEKSFTRFNADIRAYNEAAVAIAQALGLPVDDLFTVVMEAGRDRYLSADGVHFTAEGYELLGKAVAEVIKQILP
jgi:lysophospholipase L1-like esterase